MTQATVWRGHSGVCRGSRRGGVQEEREAKKRRQQKKKERFEKLDEAVNSSKSTWASFNSKRVRPFIFPVAVLPSCFD